MGFICMLTMFVGSRLKSPNVCKADFFRDPIFDQFNEQARVKQSALEINKVSNIRCGYGFVVVCFV